MTGSRETCVLAVDGGGTRCRIAIHDGAKIVSIEAGSANVSTDFDSSVEQIRSGLHELAAKMAGQMNDIAQLPAFVGLAGVTGPEIEGRLRASLPFDRLRIEDDRPAAVRGALEDRDGVIAHCGTGSFCGAQRGGKVRLSGGWGPVLGDEASAQWIGRHALAKVLEVADGRIKKSALAERLLDKFGAAAGVVRFAGTATPAEFGALAPLVTAHAKENDPLAQHLMQTGASEIARSLTLIGWTPGLPICLTGGIGPAYQTYLSSEMQADVTAPLGTPLQGALSLAWDLCREDQG
ncbi:MAG: BadF/BadG/BcrA/BcrD ATPase family protein [Pseudomonadota bacterium]